MYRINPATLRTGLAQAAGIEGSLLVLGAITGLLTGILSSLLILGIDWVSTFSWGGTVSTWELLVIPTVGAFIVGLIIQYGCLEVGGSGVVRTLEILVTRSGRF